MGEQGKGREEGERGGGEVGKGIEGRGREGMREGTGRLGVDSTKFGRKSTPLATIHEQTTLCQTTQESCAVAKMTAQFALYMVALKIFGTP